MNILSITIFLVALSILTRDQEGPKTYSVRKITSAIHFSGKGDDPLWKNAEALSDFSSPWEDEKPYPTKFRALHNDDWLYCLFEVTDPNINIYQAKNHKSEVASSSRAEIFFKIDDRLKPYYCLEIDPLGRVMDYQGNYHRKFDLNWTWPAGHLVVKTSKTAEGYTIELALSKASLEKLALLKNDSLQAGLFRADCSLNASGNPDFTWISWVKPESPTPDFHIPSSFGILRLED